jgi:hypothetical protein
MAINHYLTSIAPSQANPLRRECFCGEGLGHENLSSMEARVSHDGTNWGGSQQLTVSHNT